MIRSWAVFVAVTALAPACAGDECSENESVCVDDHTIRWCSRSHEWLEPQTCYALNPYCVVLDDNSQLPPQTSAYCASAPAKVAACAMTTDDYCTNDTRYACVDGYSVFEESCAHGCSSNACAP